MINNRLLTRKNRLFLLAATKNTFISEILTDYTVSDKDIQEPINSPPMSSQIDFSMYQKQI